MAYADQQMSNNRLVALILVALIHIGLGYMLVTGLAYEAFQKAVERVTTVDIEEPEPEPEEELPPPPEDVPVTVPPPVAPPALVNLAPPAEFVTRDDPPIVPDPVIRTPAPPAPPPAPPPPPPPKFTPKQPEPKNSRGRWVTVDDYRTSWINRDYTGTVSFRVTVGTNGRVSDCAVTGGSAPDTLKNATCKLIQRRARFNPATNGDGNEVSGSYSSTVRWQIPE